MSERIFRCRDNTKARDVMVMLWNVAKLWTEPFEVVIRPLKAKRSADQNRRLWSIYREVAATVWVGDKQFNDETWHEHFKRIFIGYEEITMPDGKTETRGISTTTLSVADMTTYMDSITHWCTEQGFPLGAGA